MKWTTLLLIYLLIHLSEESLEILSKTKASYLRKYEGYDDVNINHIEIPGDIPFVSFKFEADEARMSVFACTPRKVEIYVKHKSFPVVNGDGSKFPSSFKNISRLEPYYVTIMSDNKTVGYVNFTSPQPGCYFIATFLEYTDSKHDLIQPNELRPVCHAYVDTTVYVEKKVYPQFIDENTLIPVPTSTNEDIVYKFYTPSSVSHVKVFLANISFASKADNLTVLVQSNSIPSINDTLNELVIHGNDLNAPDTFSFRSRGDSYHFILFRFNSRSNNTVKSYLTFKIKFLYYWEQILDDSITEVSKIYYSDSISEIISYKEYNLVRLSSTDSFSYSYELTKSLSISEILPINLTSNEFAVLKFELLKHGDIGGVLHFSLAFKPRINKAKRTFEQEPDKHVIIACLRPDFPEFPSWPNFCNYENKHNIAPLMLNKSNDNATMMVPFPESGVWYASIKLFCGECIACNCSQKCRKEFEACIDDCEDKCDDSCTKCTVDCKNDVIKKEGCETCDCDGDCLRDQSSCNSSVLFDISSTACANQCGKNGRCMLMVSEGIVYASCICYNNYRGWDCSDDSYTTPYYLVVLELLLLVLSNLMFLPTVFVAYRRKYYVEAICFFAIFFFSTFYHACDAGENIISFCLVRLAALQFGDFYCALLAIWVTLLAIADLHAYWPSVCQITGAIVLAFITTINKTSVWFFIVPVASGIIIIAISWILKWKKVRQRFLNKRYLYVYVPIGFVVVCLGLLIFTFFETEDNYKYLHSLWHITMAVAAILLLPRPDTFQPEVML